MGEWRTTTIGEVLTLQRGFDITRAQQRPGSIPVVSSGGISSYHDTPMVKAPGVVIGRKGTLGKTFYLSEDYWPHDTTLWVKDFKGNLPRFVYYFFTQLDVMGLDVGSANPTLNRNHVHPIQVRWPSHRDQDHIAAVLGALDDKIAVNERIVSGTDDLLAALLVETLTDDVDTVDVPLAQIASVNVRTVRPTNGGHLRYIDISSVSPGRFDWPGRIPWADAPGRARRGVELVASFLILRPFVLRS